MEPVETPGVGAATDRDRRSDEINGVWAETMRDLISYRYFGTQSVLHDRSHSTGSMPIRSDMRIPGGMLMAPIAIGMLDAAGNNIDRLYHLGLTQIDVHLFEGGQDVNRAGFDSEVVREARTQIFTEAKIRDEASGRVLGQGTANWAIINPTPEGFVYTDPGPGPADEPPMPPLFEVFEAEPLSDGGYMIPGMSPRIGVDTLHHGSILVVMEAAAVDIIDDELGAILIRPQMLSCRIIRAGRKGPFIIRSELYARNDRVITCRSTFVDQGRGNETVAIMLWQGLIS